MPAIRRHIHIAARPRTVWKAITTSEGLRSWLVDDARIDARQGGRVVWIGEDDEGNRVEEKGVIHKWRPTSHLEISWDKMGNFPTTGTRLTFQLALDGDETRVSVIHSGSAPILDEGEDRDQLDVDWRRALKSLQTLLDSE